MTISIKSAALGLVMAVSSAGVVFAAPVNPSIGTFGDIATVGSVAAGDGFGGDGIATNATNYQTYEDGLGNKLLLGLSITQRYGSAPTPVNDGAGTFTVQPGLATPAGSSSEGTLWNFSFYAEMLTTAANTPRTLGDIGLELLYDLDSAAGTDIRSLGSLNAALFTDPSTSLVRQGSQNLNFGYLAVANPGLNAPGLNTYNPNFGEYSFLIRANNFGDDSEAGVAVIANVAPVPVPAALPLLLMGLGGLGLMRRRQQRRKA